MAIWRPQPSQPPYQPQPLLRPKLTNYEITFDTSSNSGYQSASSSYSWSHAWNGDFLSVDVSLFSAGNTVSSITFNGQSLTLIVARSTVTSFGRVECWGATKAAMGNLSPGTYTIAVTLSGSIASAGCAVSYGNVHQTSPTEGPNSNQATNAGSADDATVSITSVADQDWIHSAIATDDTAITAGQTSRNNVTGAAGSGANEDFGPQTPQSKTMNYTGLGIVATWAIAGYALRPVYSEAIFDAAVFPFPDLRQFYPTVHRGTILAY